MKEIERIKVPDLFFLSKILLNVAIFHATIILRCWGKRSFDPCDAADRSAIPRPWKHSITHKKESIIRET